MFYGNKTITTDKELTTSNNNSNNTSSDLLLLPKTASSIATTTTALVIHKSIPIGSVKSVMGHAEGCSGLMSVIKCLLMYEHKVLLPNQHFISSSHHSILEGYFQPVVETTAWEQPTPLCISNYGFGGTNAFVILEPGNIIITTDDDDCYGTTTTSTDTSNIPNFMPRFSNTVKTNVTADVTANIDYNTTATNTTNTTDVTDVYKAWFLEQAYLGNDSLYAYRQDSKSLLQSKNTSQNYTQIAFVCSGQGSQWNDMGRAMILNNEIFQDTIMRLHGYLKILDSNISLFDWYMGEETNWLLKERSGIGNLHCNIYIYIVVVDALNSY